MAPQRGSRVLEISLVVAVASCAPSARPADTAPAGPAAASSAENPFAGGACKSDSDCEGYLNCCADTAECGTHAQARTQHELCSCCVSCAAPAHPATVAPCGCKAGACAKR